MENNNFDKIISFAKRRGFVFQSSDIYGGMGGFYDFGPLGVELRNNIKNSWWNYMVHQRENIFGLDSAIIMNPNIWKASGHTETFSDPLSECKKCHKRFRTDHLKDDKCPECKGELMDPRNFNLMFRTFVGSVEDSASTAYLRPETAQGI
ncbi:MAG: glycyl-tRNA synthetase, partial [Patescibacteria group bacterium]|nr:glycyl-tRNA synthetase [Patescibacteria group bacterium]